MPILQYSSEIRSAVLLVHGEKAHSCYFSRDAFENMTKGSKYTDNKELLIIPEAVHTDLYDKTDMIPFDKLEEFFREKFYRFSDYLFKSPQMSERLGISSISGILRFGRYTAYHGISEPHLALKSSKTVVETAAYYYAASLSIAAFAEV